MLTTSWAQTTPPPNGPVQDMGQVEVRSNRDNDTEERRQSTAAKIIIGREEIERQGDASLGEVLKRLPGVTMQGAPGRGGAIRMRGLGGGYTQILLDGQRVPPGFSVDSLTPEMVEKIEIMRAPTADTGARAIAGTINIVLREGQKTNPDDLKIGGSFEHGQVSEQVNWVHNLKTEGMSGTLTLHAMNSWRPEDNSSLTQAAVQAAGAAPDALPALTSERDRQANSLGHRQALHANARMQWKGEEGKSLVLMPFLMYSQFNSNGQIDLTENKTLNGLTLGPSSDSATNTNASRFVMTRLNGQWNQRFSADSRFEFKFGLGQSNYNSNFDQIAAANAGLLSTLQESQSFRDLSQTWNGKLTQVLGNGHQVVSGVELEGVRRTEEANAEVTDDTGNLKASTQRWAIFTQDEWTINPNWSAYAGLRYENILTQGSNEEGDKRNKSAVLTPLLHALWKPVPGSRDQVRMSLTKSYKTPTLYNLVSRTYLSRESNSPTRPDRMGNPGLKPELANGIDVAMERYLNGGGVLSANVFRRNISDLIRTVTSERFDTMWAPGQRRFVSSPQNVGDAITQGIELEAKFRLNQIWADAAAVDVRSNLSFFSSRVLDVLGPNNRLDQQPSMTANLGADYRFRSSPLTLGGNVNINPDYTTRRTEQQWAYQGAKRVVDVYGLWRFSPNTAFRVTVSNLTPIDYLTGSTYIGNGFSEIANTTTRNWQTVQLRLEMKI
ncbi:MAG: TonB-dependent receptor plug domain-containing protein [Limnohabitans sp.]|nr:TonB-dependent receptor [Burkholderiales bacterium]